MKNIKKLTIGAVILLIVHFFFLYHSEKEREWASQIIETYSAEGWAVAGKFTGFGDIDSQWTRIMSPVKDVWFIKDNDIKILNGEIYSAPILHTSYENGQTKNEYGIQFFNVINENGAYLENQRDERSVDLNKVKWVTYGSRNPEAQIIKYIKTKISR